MAPNNRIHPTADTTYLMFFQWLEAAGDAGRQLCTKPDLAKLEQHSSSEMPTILRSGPYRIYFYSHEPNEPPHVHVDHEGERATGI